MERLSVQEAKQFWFQNDLTVYAGFNMNGRIAALPKVESERAIKYLHLLKSCRYLEEAQELYNKYAIDPNRPKLIPRIKNVLNMGDYLAEEWMEYHGVPRNLIDFGSELYEKIPSNFEIFSQLKNNPFKWNDNLLYVDDSGTFDACRNSEIWTDCWIPLEISREIGNPDTGIGVDYYEAELIYQDMEKFKAIFSEYGFQVNLNSPELTEILKH